MSNPTPTTSARSAFARHGAEIIIALVVLLVAAGVFAFMRAPFEPAAADQATQTVEGVGPYAVVQNVEGARSVLSLGQDTTVTVSSTMGENEISVKDGAVRVSEADCPNQICVQTGAISRPGDTIVCLPHKLVVQVVQDPAQAGAVQGLLA